MPTRYRVELDGRHDWYVPSLEEAEKIQQQLSHCMRTTIFEVTEEEGKEPVEVRLKQ